MLTGRRRSRTGRKQSAPVAEQTCLDQYSGSEPRRSSINPSSPFLPFVPGPYSLCRPSDLRFRCISGRMTRHSRWRRSGTASGSKSISSEMELPISNKPAKSRVLGRSIRGTRRIINSYQAQYSAGDCLIRKLASVCLCQYPSDDSGGARGGYRTSAPSQRGCSVAWSQSTSALEPLARL